MGQLRLVLVGVTILALTSQLINAASNCASFSECDGCGSNTKTITKHNITVCCPNCGSLFIAGDKDGGEKGYCTCYEPEVLEKEITGTCRKGSQCGECLFTQTVTWIGVKLCCADCKKHVVAFNLENKACYCLKLKV